MADAEIIDLFTRERPPTVDPTWWEWGQGFVENGVNNLDGIVEQIKYAASETELAALIRELKAEVEAYPEP